MSWDLFVQDWGEFDSLEEIPDDFEPKPLGRRIDIIETVKNTEPTIDFTDPSWGLLENKLFSIEFNMGDSEILESFVMHVRGNELALPCIGNILNELNLKATGGSTPNFFDVEKSKKDLQQWIDYRNSIIDN